MANALTAADAFVAEDAAPAEVPVWLVEKGGSLEAILHDGAQQSWVAAAGFKGAAKQHVLVPSADGRLAGVLLGIGEIGAPAEPSGPPELLLGQLAQTLPAGTYRLESKMGDPALAAIAWGVGAYRYGRYKSTDGAGPAQLRIPAGVDRAAVLNTVYAVWQGRDLINAPASDMGPAELEAGVRALAVRHGATVTVIEGDDLLAQNFPMIHAVGRASPRAPRLIDLTWGREGAATVTLIGKGILLRHRRSRHQGSEWHALDEEGHGRCGGGANPRPHDHGPEARRAAAHPDPCSGEQHSRQRVPAG